MTFALNSLRFGAIASAGGAFTPLDVPSPLYFLDAESITDDGVGNATAVLDQSAEGNDSTSGTSMAILSAYRNGRDALQSAAGDALRRVSFTGGQQAQPWEVFLVAETPSSFPSGAQYLWGSGSGTTSRCELRVTNAPVFSPITNATVDNSDITPPVSTAMAISMLFNGSSSSIEVEWHGGSTRRTYAATGLGTTAIDGFTVCSYFGGTDFPWRGTWFAAHAKKAAYSTAERNNMFAWASSKYNIVL